MGLILWLIAIFIAGAGMSLAAWFAARRLDRNGSQQIAEFFGDPHHGN